MEEGKVSKFYENKTVFITGATGFMGKVLVEKLLRSTKVRKIYLLIRPKRGVETKVRLQELMSAKIFDHLKESNPERLSVVEVVTGDITKEDFGLSQSDIQTLLDEVEVVFHSAATIRFDEKLTEA